MLMPQILFVFSVLLDLEFKFIPHLQQFKICVEGLFHLLGIDADFSTYLPLCGL